MNLFRTRASFLNHPQFRQLAGLLLCVAGMTWLWFTPLIQPELEPISFPAPNPELLSGVVARMDSPAFAYGPGWIVTPQGADPTEPADPWNQPAGQLTFDYTGRELALQMAEGNYWAYLLITVDGQPANQLPILAESIDQTGRLAGYKSLLAPELQTPDGLAPRWVVVHRAGDSGPHQVHIEAWRGWSAFPLRGVAVDALPQAPRPAWPGTLLLVIGLGIIVGTLEWCRFLNLRPLLQPVARHLFFWLSPLIAQGIALLAGALLALALFQSWWWLSLAGLNLLALAGIRRPALWVAGLLVGLPFYLFPLPLLPGFSLNLVEVGVWGGLAVWMGSLWTGWSSKRDPGPINLSWSLFALMGVALVAATASGYPHLALREWRTLFLPAALFGFLLAAVLCTSPQPSRDRTLWVASWLAGGAIMALISLWRYSQGDLLVPAEGVARLRGLYGSPNNLALYLERTLIVGLALALFDRKIQPRLGWAALSLPTAVALYFTYSKGAQLLALPTGFLILGLGGSWLVRTGQAKKHNLWLLAGVVVAAILALLPLLDTARFQGVTQLQPGSTAFFRVQLWRSSWRMGLDHWLWGVGPDNFLYAYRSAYILPSAWQEPNLNHPHNFLLDLWTRLGVAGVAAGFLFWGGGIQIGWRRFRTVSEPAIFLGLLAATAAGLAHGLIDVSYALPDLMLVWALIFAILRQDLRDTFSQNNTVHFSGPNPSNHT